MQLFRIIILTTIVGLLSAATVYSQAEMGVPPQADLPEVTDAELETFVDTILELEPIQEKANEEIEEVIQEEGFTLERFQQILMAMQNPQLAGQVNVTNDEQEKLAEMQPKLMQIQMDAEEQMIAKIEDGGLSVERYQQITQSIQQREDLQEKFEALIVEKTGDTE
jgi:hypothetical protein